MGARNPKEENFEFEFEFEQLEADKRMTWPIKEKK